MKRRYSPNHPAVMSWQAKKRQAMLRRYMVGQSVGGLALVGLSAFLFDGANEAGRNVWVVAGFPLAIGLLLLVDAVRKSGMD